MTSSTPLKKTLWQAFVTRNAAFQQTGMPVSPSIDRFLLVAAMVLASIDAIVYLSSGYHAGFLKINAYSAQFAPFFLQNLTFVGDTLTILALMFILSKNDHRLYWLIFVTAIIGTIIAHGLKESVMADRPPAVLPADSFILIGPKNTQVSFPSGHTLTVFCFAGVMLYYYRAWWARFAVFFLAAAAGLSRILVGVHWPVDVLAGAAGGLLSVYLAVQFCRRYPQGLGLRWQVFLHGVFVVCLLVMFDHDGGYPDARTLSIVLGVVGLAMAVRRYIWLPAKTGNSV
ncbi:Putative undecaprenyl-diphosphatase YbjG [BD1-7 clade bacterium]|uniref:undecaprenyl-diphosphate phosphatase n=1 Tax=BD1-7 clade bacterium TaxID=2029982 RepID=A0A5S9MZB0_9GAMM|nr:Putative undecaprenyl-diphosphatase YbjG [BD1-7 clade bacterium]CAA0082496.1 Putative undecaprenyl-diphosphatase YbjG [BD1-7 clade bacterium]